MPRWGALLVTLVVVVLVVVVAASTQIGGVAFVLPGSGSHGVHMGDLAAVVIGAAALAAVWAPQLRAAREGTTIE